MSGIEDSKTYEKLVNRVKNCSEEIAKIVIDSTKEVDLKKNWREIVKYAKVNGVAIPVLRYLKEEGLCSERHFIQLFNKEAKNYDLFWQSVIEIAQLFSRKNIEYAVIKTRRIYEFYDWDIDVLVRKEDWSKALRVLQGHGFKRAHMLSHPLASLEADKLLMEKRGGFPIHLHRRVSWHGVEYLSSDLVLSSSLEVEGVYYPSKAIDALIYCAHSIFENYELTLGEVYHFMKTADSSVHDFILSLANENGWLEGARLSIKAMKNIWSSLNSRECIKLPYRYELRSLLKAWSEHAQKRGLNFYEVTFINFFKYLLKRCSEMRWKI
jgi:hypothetical protein